MLYKFAQLAELLTFCIFVVSNQNIQIHPSTRLDVKMFTVAQTLCHS